ncbi:MAG: pentapeptide repeat-containing protein [Candidatus Binatia bacterium]
MALKPLTYEDPLFQLLRDGNVKEFNRRKGEQQSIAMKDCDFRHLDLRGLDASGVDFSDSYFRGADFSKARLDGASLNSARISGGLFPAELTPQEIELSVTHGARLRYRM